MLKPYSSVFPLETLARELEGELYADMKWRLLYATDASVYREIPEAVCRPKNKEDLYKVVDFCRKHRLPIVPRTAGTSLAGQVVGGGMVVDFSRYLNKVLELNAVEKWVRVQPGVILDELNDFLKPHGLFFGPETSTSNRCMIGGMVANNACGAHSLVYGSTRDHTLEITALLSDGSEVVFGPLDNESFRKKCIGNSLENKLYRQIFECLSDKKNQEEIRRGYPDPRIRRRNTGYALDLLMESSVFSDVELPFNFSRLLCGSEGTLALFTEIKLNLVPLPPPETALVCVHLNTVEEAFHANLVALDHLPVAVELIDRVILECTKTNLSQKQNRFFLQGDPGAILVVEFAGNQKEEILQQAAMMEARMRREGLGYYFPVLFGADIGKVWALRKAGLGLLSNVPGDAKPVAVIEDVAVLPEALPAFMKELQLILDKLNLSCVYYAHIGTGEIHLRPVLNLKNPADVERFFQVARETAMLVRLHRGSLSGEHGDGRLRGEFIPLVIGEHNAALLREVKAVWDPHRLFNPGKITDTPSMKSKLRYQAGLPEKKMETFLDFSGTGGFLRAVEKCNGSGDCRKPHSRGGVMCPSYHASQDEDATTRGRANILREFLTYSPEKKPFAHREVLEVLDLCLSCKGCLSECPSNVDMARYKAEYLFQYHQIKGIPLRARIIGNFERAGKLGSLLPRLYNLLATGRLSAPLIKYIAGFSQNRSLPAVSRTSLRRWAGKRLPTIPGKPDGQRQVILFCDEFTNYHESNTGKNTVRLLWHLGYQVIMPRHAQSGRALISKGLLKKARKVASKNVACFAGMAGEDLPIVGIEPSAILGFRDEYPDLVGEDLRDAARELSRHCFTLEEFLCREFERGSFGRDRFSEDPVHILVHGHCHQKALSSVNFSLQALSIPVNANVREINCGCCGMAGSFGYEKEHYALSMQIGELDLFPAIRKAGKETLIAAPGTSCRQQILDGTGRQSHHPADILFMLLKRESAKENLT
jgi:FAD/FMN-containing dehydrogenase/Fe-S oxidoreductase